MDEKYPGRNRRGARFSVSTFDRRLLPLPFTNSQTKWYANMAGPDLLQQSHRHMLSCSVDHRKTVPYFVRSKCMFETTFAVDTLSTTDGSGPHVLHVKLNRRLGDFLCGPHQGLLQDMHSPFLKRGQCCSQVMQRCPVSNRVVSI